MSVPAAGGSRQAWLELIRLPAVVSAWSNVLAAHLVATAGAPDPTVLILQIGITTALYWAGMILNDCFDLEEDRRERPERPLPSGRIRPSAAWAAAGALIAAALLLALAAGERILWVTLALAAAVLLYDAWLKRGALGPLAMGLCRYLNWIMGLAVAPVLAAAPLVLPLAVLPYTAGVTWLSRAETGTGIREGVSRATAALGAAAAAVVALYPIGVQTQPLALIPLLVLLAALGRVLWRVHAEPSAARVRRGVRAMLLGMIVLDAVLLAGAGQWAAAVALLPLALAGRLLARGISPT